MLVSTKLHVPPLRPGLVARDELVARLVDGEQRKLALVCAPAGWGKTVLLAQWRESPREQRPFAWLSLDPSDDDPVRFWTYVVEALRAVEPEVGASALAVLPAARGDLVDVVVPLVLNDLASLTQPLVLVLDDYHAVRHELIQTSVSYLLRHLPTTVQVALGSRADPPLPLGSLRAAGEVTEIRAAALRFQEPEAETLLNGSLGLDLAGEEVGLLCQRTEGWAAGLQLAALSLRTHEAPRTYAARLAGDDRQIGTTCTTSSTSNRARSANSSYGPRSWSDCAPRSATPSRAEPTPPTSLPARSAPTSSSSLSTHAVTGTATTSSSATSFGASSSSPTRESWPSCTDGRRRGFARAAPQRRRSRMRRPPAIGTARWI